MQFPETRNFTGFFAPSGVEGDVVRLPLLSGAAPRDIAGDFYRVAPDPQFPPRAGDDIWFNGDGMVTRFRFQDGEVSLKQRWVETDKFKLEREAGRALFGAYRNPLGDDPSVSGVYRGTANTNVVPYAGKLFALKEDSPPVAMDPDTLETLGYWDFDGALKVPTFTAHPKIDPKTGDMLAFSYATAGLCTRDMNFCVIDPQGKIVRQVAFDIPYYCMMHDFGVTEDYVVFHVVPIVGSWERLQKSMPHFGFDTKLPIYLGVLPRDGSAEDLRWFKAPTVFASHVMNAFNEGPVVHFDTMMAAGNMFPFFPDVDGKPYAPDNAEGHLTRWTVDLRQNDDAIQMTRLCDLVGEFPRIDDRFTGLPYRYGFHLVEDRSKPVDLPGGRSATGFMMNTLARVEVATGKSQTWWVGPTSSLQEPCFIPRAGSKRESDGYMVAVENRLAEMQSRLLLFDAERIDDGPIATFAVPFRLRPALHGNWRPASRTAQ